MGRRVPLPDALAADIDRIFEIWSDCQRRYPSDGDWLFGNFSVADAMYAPVVLRFRTYGIKLPESATAYPERLLQSEALQDWLAAAESETEVIEREEIGQ
jgi:glutathione S-transferase